MGSVHPNQDSIRRLSKMNNTIKALLGAALLTVVMTGCETMAERAAKCPDGKACNPAQCDDNANCDPSKCEKKDCPKAASACKDGSKAECKDGDAKACSGDAKACADGKAASCKDGCTKPCCADKEAKACGADCTKPCCADKQVCSHPNSTFSCPNCTDGNHCCAGCAAKDAAACPDCHA